MLQTPKITLTATLDDITGQPAGSVANPAKLQISLCNYGLILPQVPGTATLTAIASFDVVSTGTEISIALWGNDVITPLNYDGTPKTYYCITVIDGLGNIVQSALYQFTGTTTIDLSNAVPYTPPKYPPVPPIPTYFVLTDTVAPHSPFTLYIANGQMQVVAGGTGQTPITNLVLLDTGNANAPVTIEITNGQIQVVLGGANGVPFVAFNDVLTGFPWQLIMVLIGGIETPQVVPA